MRFVFFILWVRRIGRIPVPHGCVTMPDGLLRFIHLSDLHFRFGPGRTGTLHDRDATLRVAIGDDIRRRRDRDGWTADGLLVSGDVAYAGRAEEYAMALAWFRDVAEIAGCAPEAVWMVPGNHDIDRSIVERSPALQAFRREVRACPRDEIDDVLRRWMTSTEATLLFAPLAAYNDFAAAFGCRVGAENPFWERPFLLNDGSTLRLRGMTSVLGSDGSDSDESNRLVIGSMQWGQMSASGTTTLVMCHHPPEWIRDAQAFDDALPPSAPVQIFGHMHRQRVRTLNNSLRLFSGAAQPDRSEKGWHPLFNLLTLSVDGAGNDRRLRVGVEMRTWAEEAQAFVDAPVGDARSSGSRTFEFALEEWYPPTSTVVRPARDVAHGGQIRTAGGFDGGGAPDPAEVDNAMHGLGAPSSNRRQTVDPIRALVYRYLTLPHRDRVAVAQLLDLVRDEDDGMRDAELVEHYFARARSAGKLADVWRAVEAHHADSSRDGDNPFTDTLTHGTAL